MKHLSAAEFVDDVEGRLPDRRRTHLDACRACAEQARIVRDTLREAHETDVPEPSPLFWQHLSARVHDAIAAEGTPNQTARGWLIGWRMWTAGASALIACIAAVVLTSRVPSEPAPPASHLAESIVPPDALPDDDPALNLVADLASTLTYEEASELETSTHAGSVDEAVGGLSAAERQELHRLLNDALRHPGD